MFPRFQRLNRERAVEFVRHDDGDRIEITREERRDVVDRIIELNSSSAVASDGVLRVGETLRLPVAG